MYEQRGRDASRLTLPTLLPPLGATGATLLPTPWQSVGARGVNNLSSKLLLSLFPPNEPFFRLEVSNFAVQKMTGRPDMMAEVQKALQNIESEVQTEIETTAIRPSISEALKHLIVTGNVLLYMLPEGGIRLYHLLDYAVHRDPAGNVLEIITHEMLSPAALPDNLKHLAKQPDATKGKGTDDRVEKNLDLYTWVRRKQNQWTIHQEINNQKVPGSQATYPLDKSPWIPLRWTCVDGEDYGRGFVEEYQGDLQTLEGLTQSIVEGAAAAAKVIVLVNPNGVTSLKMIQEAPNGAVRAGVETDVKFMQAQKQGDFTTATTVIKDVTERLSYAFMLNSAVQRQAERVTAAEIRYMAQELETTLGGLYSILSQELQLPLVKRLMFQMERQGKLPPLPKQFIKPTIVTGLEALGRGNDLDKLDQFIQGVAEVFGPGAIQTWINPTEYFTRRATAIGIDSDGLIKTQQEVQQEMQQQQMQQAAQQAVPHAAKALGDVVTHNATQAQGQGPAAEGGSQGS